MKMMIIDDEINIREGIRYSIPWAEVGINSVRDYSCGEKALKDFSQYLPDIVISDIRMNGMTGLEFLSKAKEIKTNFKTIFISGYADFEYVIQAMKLGAVDYELKPLNNEKLMSIVKKARQDILDYNQQQEVLDEVEEKKRAKRTFEILNTQEIQENINMYFHNIYELDIRTSLIVALLEVDNYHNTEEDMIQKYLETVKGELETKIDIKLWEYHNGVCMIMAEVNSSYLYAYNVQHAIKRSIEYTNVRRTMDMTVSAAISATTTIKNILDVYSRIQEVLQDKFYKGRGSIYFLNEKKREGSCVENNNIEDLKQDFLLAFASMDIKKVEEVLDKFQKLWAFSRSYTKIEIKKIISDLMKELMLQQIRDKSMVIIDIIQFNEQMRDLNFLENIIIFWRDWIEDYYQKCSMKQGGNYSKNIKKALKYILQNYRKEISAESVSEYIGKTPNYFSSLFKKEIGMNFSEYVNVLRIKKAKELMANSDMLLNEIAEYVGYSNYIYFSQVFKKIEGITPSQNRKSHREF